MSRRSRIGGGWFDFGLEFIADCIRSHFSCNEAPESTTNGFSRFGFSCSSQVIVARIVSSVIPDFKSFSIPAFESATVETSFRPEARDMDSKSKPDKVVLVDVLVVVVVIVDMLAPRL